MGVASASRLPVGSRTTVPPGTGCGFTGEFGTGSRGSRTPMADTTPKCVKEPIFKVRCGGKAD